MSSVEMAEFREQAEKDREAFIKQAENDREAFIKQSEKEREAFSNEIRSLIQAGDERYKQREAERDKEWRRYNLDLGRIANKHGTMVEDLVGPSICRILRETLGVDEDTPCYEQVRVKRPYRGDKSRRREFDVIAECLDYVLINETKSSLITADIDKFLETMSSLRDYFPEYADYKLIGAVASLYIDEGVVNYATKKGLLALAVGMELMDVQNPPGFQPKVW
jgi:hypothetical protein